MIRSIRHYTPASSIGNNHPGLSQLHFLRHNLIFCRRSPTCRDPAALPHKRIKETWVAFYLLVAQMRWVAASPKGGMAVSRHKKSDKKTTGAYPDKIGIDPGMVQNPMVLIS